MFLGPILWKEKNLNLDDVRKISYKFQLNLFSGSTLEFLYTHPFFTVSLFSLEMSLNYFKNSIESPILKDTWDLWFWIRMWQVYTSQRGDYSHYTNYRQTETEHGGSMVRAFDLWPGCSVLFTLWTRQVCDVKIDGDCLFVKRSASRNESHGYFKLDLLKSRQSSV